MLGVAIICPIAVTYLRDVNARRARQIQYVPYSPETIARCQETGTPVIVVYQDCWATRLSKQVWATAPFDDPQTARLLNEMKFVVMDPIRDIYSKKMSWADCQTMERAIPALGGELPIIVIYDPRGGGAVIRPKDESIDERSQRVGKLLRDYATRRGKSSVTP